MAGLMAVLSSPTPLQIPKTVVFCQTKDKASRMHELLRSCAYQKSVVSMYHASLTQQTKSFIQQTFLSINSQLRCLVATVAFGMVSFTTKSHSTVELLFFLTTRG